MAPVIRVMILSTVEKKPIAVRGAFIQPVVMQ
jgi:hypothetical protein